MIKIIKQILEPHTESIKNCEGIFTPNFLDLDSNGYKFFLWLDGDAAIEINVTVNLENASMIQSVIRDLGKEVVHTWNQQYSINP
jgi:hypothetical protein